MGRSTRATVLALAVPAALAALLAGCGGEPPPNIVLVVLDTVRADHTGRDGAAGSATPNLDRLAAEGTLFASAWADAPWTVPSHASLFTGLPPWEHGCSSASPRLAPDLPTAAEHLAREGYSTAAFFSNPWLGDRTTGLLRGFEEKREAVLPTFFDAQHRDPDGDQGGRRTAESFARWLRERGDDDRPFFAFLNFLEAHLPYDPPADVRRRHLPELGPHDWIPVSWGHEFNAGLRPPAGVDWPRVRSLYRGDVLAADQLLGRVLAALEAAGLRERTILIVTSDHGENLGEHGLVEHQYSLHETLLAVPLVVRMPETLRPRLLPGRREDPVRLADLHATLLDLAGSRRAPPAGSVSLLRAAGAGAAAATAPPADRPLVAQYGGPSSGLLRLLSGLNPDLDPARLAPAYRSLRVGTERLTVGTDGSLRLHDLGLDPGQEQDLSSARPGSVERLLARLAELCPRKLEPAAASGAATELDPETRRRLRALGYVH